MIREICDVCKKNDADTRYMFKRSVKNKWWKTSLGYRVTKLIDWTPDEEIMICSECAEKLFSIKND